LVELGLSLAGVRTALTVERAMDVLRAQLAAGPRSGRPDGADPH
jgi:hypothetical protein